MYGNQYGEAVETYLARHGKQAGEHKTESPTRTSAAPFLALRTSNC
jgi:hypothetical protein